MWEAWAILWKALKGNRDTIGGLGGGAIWELGVTLKAEGFQAVYRHCETLWEVGGTRWEL